MAGETPSDSGGGESFVTQAGPFELNDPNLDRAERLFQLRQKLAKIPLDRIQERFAIEEKIIELEGQSKVPPESHGLGE